MPSLYSAFEKLPTEKKEHILKICIEEFAQNGYENTSTDTITKRAGISKGSLFHYFKSKKKLYLYLFEYVLDLLTRETLKELDQIQREDFLDFIKEVAIIKQKVIMRFYQESRFVLNAYSHPPSAVKEEIEKIYNKHLEANSDVSKLESIYHKQLIDKERLRENVTVEQAYNITMMVMEQFTQKYIRLYKNHQFDFFVDMEPLKKELDDYLKILKYGIYKS